VSSHLNKNEVVKNAIKYLHAQKWLKSLYENCSKQQKKMFETNPLLLPSYLKSKIFE